MRVVTEDVVLAAMAAVEEETLARAAQATADYAAARGGSRPSSRIAGAKVKAARELGARIAALPRKGKGGGR